MQKKLLLVLLCSLVLLAPALAVANVEKAAGEQEEYVWKTMTIAAQRTNPWNEWYKHSRPLGTPFGVVGNNDPTTFLAAFCRLNNYSNTHKALWSLPQANWIIPTARVKVSDLTQRLQQLEKESAEKIRNLEQTVATLRGELNQSREDNKTLANEILKLEEEKKQAKLSYLTIPDLLKQEEVTGHTETKDDLPWGWIISTLVFLLLFLIVFILWRREKKKAQELELLNGKLVLEANDATVELNRGKVRRQEEEDRLRTLQETTEEDDYLQPEILPSSPPILLQGPEKEEVIEVPVARLDGLIPLDGQDYVKYTVVQTDENGNPGVRTASSREQIVKIHKFRGGKRIENFASIRSHLRNPNNQAARDEARLALDTEAESGGNLGTPVGGIHLERKIPKGRVVDPA